MFHVPEMFRYSAQGSPFSTSADDGNNGVFIVKLINGATLQVVASDGLGWEHVSVSLPDRNPTWTEMCFVKDMFWDSEDCVVQYHPPKSDYINNHPHCLHLWRPVGVELLRPPKTMVGV